MSLSCSDCQFSINRNLYSYCRSPQLRAATNRETLTNFERGVFEAAHDWFRDTEQTRKCGPEGLNFVARTS